jgi:hypothetical protein
MLRFRASMMSTTLPPRCGAGDALVSSLPLLFSRASQARECGSRLLILRVNSSDVSRCVRPQTGNKVGTRGKEQRVDLQKVNVSKRS